jgi:hypothetical protein
MPVIAALLQRGADVNAVTGVSANMSCVIVSVTTPQMALVFVYLTLTLSEVFGFFTVDNLYSCD